MTRLFFNDKISDMLFLPVTRTDSAHITRIVDAFDRSDIPRSVLLYLDAPDTEQWIVEFSERGWDVAVRRSGNDTPPVERLDRWRRHFEMRRAVQSWIVEQKSKYILLSEDDTIVPAHIWHDMTTTLKTIKNSELPAVTGVQRSRYAGHYIGVMNKSDAGCYDPVPLGLNSGTQRVDSSGLYALMIRPEDMAHIETMWSVYEPIDRVITRQFKPLVVDTNVWCGHLLDNGAELL